MIFSAVNRSSNIQAVIPVIVTIACLVPFVGKAFHMDDPLFIWSAKQIQKSPADFYGFNVNWYGKEAPMAKVNQNPPATAYYIAIVSWLFGSSEVVLHLAFLVPAVAVVLGVFYLARLFCSRPMLAALATVLTPAFLVSSTNVMCDTMMLAFWVWAVFFWVQGIKKDKQLSLFFAAVLISVCALTKYFGTSLVGLLFVYTLMRRRKVGIWVLFLLIPVIVLSGYQWITYKLYSLGLLSDAIVYVVRSKQVMGAGLFLKALTTLAFVGGCITVPLFYSYLLWSRRVLIGGVVSMALIVFALVLEESVTGSSILGIYVRNWSFCFQFSLMFVIGAGILGLACTDFWKCRDAESLLLLFWILGTVIFVAFINHYVNARTILPIAPAVGILLVRRIEHYSRTKSDMSLWRIAWPLIPPAVIAISVCWADYTMAGTARDAVGFVKEKFGNRDRNIWFEGHWGFQYYMEEAGGRALDFFKHSKLASGDIIIIPSCNTNVRPLPANRVRLNEVLQVGRRRWLATIDTWLGANFYADAGVPLPFVIGPVRPGEYYFYVVN